MGWVPIEFANTFTRYGSPVAHLVREDGWAIGLRLTSVTATVSGAGWAIAQIQRQGRKPLSRRANPQLRTLAFSHTLANENEPWGDTVTLEMKNLLDLADSGQKVRLINVTDDVETRGWWWPAVSANIVDRWPDQSAKRVELSWTLLESVDERPKIARIPPPPPPPPPPAAAAAPPQGQGDYVVVKGDSLWRIAARFLGDGGRWPEIFDLNQSRLNLAPAEMYRGLLTVWIYPGQVMQIPAR